MSDAQKLKDCIKEYRKSNKALDDKLNKIAENNRLARQEAEGQSHRQG